MIHYNITFLDYWHLSSGLSAGAKLDSTVIKDADGLPYVPGKTLKGLVREMAELLPDNEAFVSTCFGEEVVQMGACYFTNATLDDALKEQIRGNKLQEKLYDELASTQIDKEGMAVDNSLREIEVTIPLTLQGKIDDVPSAYEEKMKQALKMIKRMGLNRNRGLGRCIVEVTA